MDKRSNAHANIIKISPEKPDNGIIKKAGEIISEKGMIIFPAQYFYGIAVDALNIEAVQKVFLIKQRVFQNPLLALIKDRKQLESLIDSIPENAEKLIKKYWPGNITIIFKAAKHIPELLTANTGKIGLRIPWHPVAKALVNATDKPITGTSANISGQPGCNKVSKISPLILENSDMILDAGELRIGLGSTVVDVTDYSIKIIRQGQIPASDIFKTISKQNN